MTAGSSRHNRDHEREEGEGARAVYLLELSPALGEDDDLVVERLPRGVLEAELDDVDGGLPGAGHVPGQPALLLHVEERLDRRVQVALLHPPASPSASG